MTSWLRYTENHTSQSKRKSTLSDRNLQHQSPHSLSPPSLPHSPHVQTPYLDPWLASVPDHLTEVVFAQSTPLPCSWTPGRPQYPPEILSPTPRRYIMDQLNPLGNSWRSDEYSLKGKEKEERWNMVPSMRQTHSGLPDDSTRLEPSTGPWDAPKRAFTHDKAHGSSGSRGPGSIRIGPLPSAILASIMDTSAGRDKVLKTIQYTLKTYLYLLSLIARVRPLSIWFKANSKRMKIATGSLSLTRKCLLLLNPLRPLTHLLSPEPTSATTLLRHLIDLTGALADDVYCLSLLGILSRRRGRFAERWANRFWLLKTILGLWKLHTLTIPHLSRRLPLVPPLVHPDQPHEEETTDKALATAQWMNHKLVADLAFVSYEVFHLSWAKEPVQCITGLISGVISTALLYDQEYDASLGKG